MVAMLLLACMQFDCFFVEKPVDVCMYMDGISRIEAQGEGEYLALVKWEDGEDDPSLHFWERWIGSL